MKNTDHPLIPQFVQRHLTPDRKRFIKFGVVGSSGVFVNLAFVWLALLWTEDESISSAIGIFVSVFTNFLLNDAWTWGDRSKKKGAATFILRVLQYYLASGIAIAIQFGTTMVFIHVWSLSVFLGQLTGIALGMFVNFVVNNFWTFREIQPNNGDEESKATLEKGDHDD